MKTSTSILVAVFLTACIFQSALASSTDQSSFELWLETFDPSATPGDKNSVLCANAADGFYAFPGECTQAYYACVGGVQYDQTCPNNFVFDPVLQNCVSPDSAPCKTTTLFVSTTTVAPTPTSFQCTADGFFPVGTCSHNYYACIGGLLYPQVCPGTGVYDPSISACVSPNSLPACSTTTSTTAIPTDTTTTSTTAIPTDTTTTSTTAIPTDTTTTSTTAIPTDTTTTSTTVVVTDTTTTTVTPFTCPSPDGFFGIPGACSSEYYICVDGIPYKQTCPAGVFDPALSVCIQLSASPSCGATTTTPTTTTPTTTTPTTTTPTTTTPTTTKPTTVPPFVCPATGQYPYPGSCTLYYVCGGGIYVIASCPIGQVFNPLTQFCEPPGNVPGCTVNFIEYYQGMKLVGMRGGVLDAGSE